LRHIPTDGYARRIVEKLTPLYFDFLEGGYRVLKDGGYLVFVTPYIRTRSGAFVAMDLEEKAAMLGFKLVCPFEKRIFAEDNRLVEDLAEMSAFVDMEERHKVGREIHVFKK
jgi:tRNA G10  N-methylase Trm11